MQIKRASRKKAKLKVGLFGPSGSGKTYSALLMANGFADWEKIVVIDTERQSADLYSHLGPYSTLQLNNFEPEIYINAIKLCEREGFEVIIIDSITHGWEKLLKIHGNMTGSSFNNWSKTGERHSNFLEAILVSNCHVISTCRKKQDYILVENDKGKMVPQKVGLKDVTRDGFDYEMTVCFDLDIKHFATCSKDRTGLFMDKPEFVISQETGKQMLDWSNEGVEVDIDECEVLRKNIKDLMAEKTIPLIRAQEVTSKNFEEIKNDAVALSEAYSDLRVYVYGETA